MIQTQILMVEDDPIVALEIEQRLLQLGYQITAIANCAEMAIASVNHILPDLALIDIHLQGEINAIQIALRLREQFNIPVIFLTDHADTATLEQVRATKPFGYLVKPFDDYELSTMIEIALSRYAAEVAIQKALKKERELHQIKSRLLSTVSHEFRTPLSSIQFALDLLERQSLNFNPVKHQSYVNRARESLQELQHLVEECLLVSETLERSLQFSPEPCDVVEFCTHLVSEIQMAISGSHVFNLTFNGLTETQPLTYAIDPKLLRRILSNLLMNAVKYSPCASQIDLILIGEEQKLTFQVRDSGIGIPPGDRSFLFNPFYRGSNIGAISGWGLGLAIVKQCVEAHGGTITVESEVGSGTTFTVILEQQRINFESRISPKSFQDYNQTSEE